MTNKLIKKCENCNNNYEYLYKRRKTTRFCSKGCATSFRQRIHDPNFLLEEGELKYYVLGLLFSDGNLSTQKGKIERLTLGLTDKDLIVKLKPYVCPERKLYIQEFDNPNHNNFYTLINTNPEAISIAKKYGMTENKSHSIKFPEIPKDMTHHFIRGFFDGDGSIYYNKVKQYTYKHTSLTTASKIFAEKLSEELNNKGIVSHISKDTRGHTYYVKIYSKKSIELLGDYLYKDSNFHMNRKKEKLQNDIV